MSEFDEPWFDQAEMDAEYGVNDPFDEVERRIFDVAALIAEARSAGPCAWCDNPATGYAYQTDEHTYPDLSCGEHGWGYNAASLVKPDLHIRLVNALESLSARVTQAETLQADLDAADAKIAALQGQVDRLRWARRDAWWRGVSDQWKHRPIGNRIPEVANPYSPPGTRNEASK